MQEKDIVIIEISNKEVVRGIVSKADDKFITLSTPEVLLNSDNWIKYNIAGMEIKDLEINKDQIILSATFTDRSIASGLVAAAQRKKGHSVFGD